MKSSVGFSGVNGADSTSFRSAEGKLLFPSLREINHFSMPSVWRKCGIRRSGTNYSLNRPLSETRHEKMEVVLTHGP